MHNAPSVSYPVGRCAFQRLTFVALSGITAVVMLVWLILQPVSWPMGLSGAAALLGIVLGWRSLQAQAGTLSWDGQVWCWHSRGDRVDDEIGQITVSLDVQSALLLQWQPSSDTLVASSRYLWLGQERAAIRWQNLRCAVYGRAPLR
jgi:toxin CptA